MGEVFLVRHGATEWSENGRHTGVTDLELCPSGEKAATAVGARLANRDIGLVLTSPMKRARETCRLAGLSGQAEVTTDLCEWNYGEYEGRTTKDIRTERPGWSVWTDETPGGESAAEVGARVDRVIERARGVECDVVLFAHGHVLRVLGARWIALPPQDGMRLALSTASICVLGYERETPVLDRWNDVSHLRG